MYSLISYFVQLAGLNLSSCVLLGWLASVIKKLKVSQILSWTLACIFQRNILGLLVKYKVRSESMLLISYKHQSRSRSFECNQKKNPMFCLVCSPICISRRYIAFLFFSFHVTPILVAQNPEKVNNLLQ